MTENKWRENLKETTRLITSQAFSLKITNLILELQYGLMVINFDRAHVHTHIYIYIYVLWKPLILNLVPKINPLGSKDKKY